MADGSRAGVVRPQGTARVIRRVPGLVLLWAALSFIALVALADVHRRTLHGRLISATVLVTTPALVRFGDGVTEVAIVRAALAQRYSDWPIEADDY